MYLFGFLNDLTGDFEFFKHCHFIAAFDFPLRNAMFKLN